MRSACVFPVLNAASREKPKEEGREVDHSARGRAHHRHLGAVLTALCVPLLLIAVWFRVYFRAFYSSARPAFPIPGLSENFVPQGIEACGGGDFLLSGYIAGTGSARLYYVDAGGSFRAIRVCDEKGTTLTSHSGGICTNGPFTYLAGGDGVCYVLSSADLFDPASREANILGAIRTDNAASFCCLEDGRLFVGEYEYGRFKTAASHHILTPAGDENTAVMLAYQLDGDQPFGVSPAPSAAYSMPARIQGMCFTGDGRVALSASSFQASSRMLFYDLDAVTRRQGIFWTGGEAIPLYYLDRSSCTDKVPLPPYSEETVYSDGRLYVLFESASSRFRFGQLIGAQNVYRMDVPGRKEE